MRCVSLLYYRLCGLLSKNVSQLRSGWIRSRGRSNWWSISGIHKLVYGKDIRISMTEQQRKAYDALPPSFRIAAVYELLEKKVGFSKDQVKKFLGKQRYFTRIVKGEYRKNYVEISE